MKKRRKRVWRQHRDSEWWRQSSPLLSSSVLSLLHLSSLQTNGLFWHSVVAIQLPVPTSLFALLIPKRVLPLTPSIPGFLLSLWSLELFLLYFVRDDLNYYCGSGDLKILLARKSEMPSMSPFGLSMNESNKPSYKWRRVLLKVSGEALAGDRAQNIDPKVCIPIIIHIFTL